MGEGGKEGGERGRNLHELSVLCFFTARVVLFMDEADAFLRKRSKVFLYHVLFTIIMYIESDMFPLPLSLGVY